MIEQTVLIGLSAWRISAWVSYERGPFDIFLRLRKALGFQHNDNGEPTVWPSGFIQQAIACPWCLSVYAVIGIWGLWQVSEPAVIVLAAAAVAIGVEKWNRPQ